MIGRTDTRTNTVPTKPVPKPMGEVAGEVAGKVGIGTDDGLVLSKKAVTPAQVKDAFERLDKAQAKARGLSVGTLGAFPAYQKALEEVQAAKDEIDGLRKQAPKLVAAEEASRKAEAEESKKGILDFFKKWVLFPLAPVPVALWNLFGKKD